MVAILSKGRSVNSLTPSDTIWWHGSWSTMVQVMARCLTAPSHNVEIYENSWNLPVRMEGSLVRNFNNYYVLLIYWWSDMFCICITLCWINHVWVCLSLLIHVFDGCSNRLDPCDHFNLVCCCLSPVLISDKRSCWKISQSLKPIWLDVEMLIPL